MLVVIVVVNVVVDSVVEMLDEEDVEDVDEEDIGAIVEGLATCAAELVADGFQVDCVGGEHVLRSAILSASHSVKNATSA